MWSQAHPARKWECPGGRQNGAQPGIIFELFGPPGVQCSKTFHKRIHMKNCRRTLLWLPCLVLLAFSSFGQEGAVQSSNLRLESMKLKDLKRTAHRYRITIDQLANARTALKEATDLAMRMESPTNDYSMLARMWIQLDRKKSREAIASLLAQVCTMAESAEDLPTYRQSTSIGVQLLTVLGEVDPEKAAQIKDLWPAPAPKIGEAGQQALAQFQTDAGNRLATTAGAPPLASVEQYLDPQKSATLPLMNRINLASSLMSSNQRDKAKALLDQAIVDMGKAVPESGKAGDYENFLRGLASLYPERLTDAFEIYRGLFARQDSANPGTIYEAGDQRILLTPLETTTLNMIRGLYGRPELTLKLMEANPGLRSKLAALGGIDRIINPSAMSGNVPARLYPANSPPPPPVSNAVQPGGISGDARGNTASGEKPLDPAELFRTLRGKAEFNPELVRRKLADVCTKKEHFNILINLAQISSSQDPDLGSVALELARGFLTAFDSLQQQESALRTLINTMRQVDGEVDPGLIRQGFTLVSDMKEEEKKRVLPQGGTLLSLPIHPSDDLEIMLIAQMAMDDFTSAIQRARSMDADSARIRALLQIAQSLMSYY
jgi:hypothetical protein